MPAGADVPVPGQDAPVSRLRSPHDRAIALLAVPALGALIADPLLSLVDTAFVGRLGAEQLAALGVASAVFGVAFFVFNFLEYGTTSEVARAIGRGDTAAAGRAVVTALSIAAVAGAAVAVVLLLAAGAIMGAFGATPAVAGSGATYVVIRALAAPAVLIVRASHGAFRGFQDTKTPMVVALAANGLNLLLDPLLIFGFGWGIAGAAWATVIAQWGAAAWFAVLFIRRAEGFGLRGARPVPGELRRFLAVGRDLAIRTAALMATFTMATAIATRVSSEAVAAHQVLSGLFLFTALALDALAIAAQALVGRHMGAGDATGASALADRLLVLGVGVGVVLMAGLAAIGGVVPTWFTTDEAVRSAIRSSYWILAAMQPLAAVVFIWDGVFIGLGDFRYLAGAMLVAAASGIAFLFAVLPMGWGLPGVWAGITLFLGVRALTLGWRRWGRWALLPGGSA
jgi:putative MATE family efflux protein